MHNLYTALLHGLFDHLTAPPLKNDEHVMYIVVLILVDINYWTHYVYWTHLDHVNCTCTKKKRKTLFFKKDEPDGLDSGSLSHQLEMGQVVFSYHYWSWPVLFNRASPSWSLFNGPKTGMAKMGWAGLFFHS